MMIPAELSKHALQHAPSEAHRLEMLAVNLLADEAEATLRQKRQAERAIEKPSISAMVDHIRDAAEMVPTKLDIVQILAEHYYVKDATALQWLRAADFGAFELQEVAA